VPKTDKMQVTEDKYYISEIFESIQGEGNFAGVYSLFIRFHFCNLNCSWCDTKYTWLEKSGTFKIYSEEELKSIIKESKPYHIIFTGGEPALYRLDKLAVEGKKIHVETNATIIPTAKLSIELSDKTIFERNPMDDKIVSTFNWVVSPKLNNSKQKVNEEALNYWTRQKFCIYKFIIKSLEDLNEIEQFIYKFGISDQKVYIGLEGITLQSQVNPDLVADIIRRGYNFSPRLQVLLWGNERGR
jgi:7-carboxy-7-deazaguanine synthase